MGKRTMKSAGASHALVLENGTPTAVIPREELAGGRVDRGHSLERTSISLEFPRGEAKDLEVYFNQDSAVLVHHSGPFVVHSHLPLEGSGDLRRLLGESNMYAIAADTELPGKGQPIPDREVTYLCEHGHRIRQDESNPNRTCPIDGTPLTQ